MSKNIRCWLLKILHVWVALITHWGLLHLPPSLRLYEKIVKHDSCRRSSTFLSTHLHTWYFIIFFTCFIQLAEKILEKTFYFFPLLLPAPGIPLGFLKKKFSQFCPAVWSPLCFRSTWSSTWKRLQQHLATTKFWQSHYYLFHFITFSIENRIKINQFSGRTIRKAFLSLSRQRFKECRLNWTYHLRFFFQKVFTSDFLFFKFSY